MRRPQSRPQALRRHNRAPDMTDFRLAAVVAATIVLLVPASDADAQNASRRAQPTIGTRAAPVLEQRGLRFRDLNRNGRIDPYEDWRLPPAARARDLVAQMTLEEKAGAMMHGTARATGPM